MRSSRTRTGTKSSAASKPRGRRSSTPSTCPAPVAPVPAPTLAEATRFWARLGCLSFGGPAGQIAIMHREIVERRRWISEEDFLHALNVCMLLPGPEAQQLTISRSISCWTRLEAPGRDR